MGPELQNGKEIKSNTSSSTLLFFIIITKFKLSGVIRNWEFKISNECLACMHRKQARCMQVLLLFLQYSNSLRGLLFHSAEETQLFQVKNISI